MTGENSPAMMENKLPSNLSWKDSFLFPVSTPDGRIDILIGGLLILFLWPLGWVLNLGHRLEVVARLYRGETPCFLHFQPWRRVLKRGSIAALTILGYLSPAILLSLLAWALWSAAGGFVPLLIAGLALAAFCLAVFTLPGCMTIYATLQDASVLVQPVRAFRRAWAHREVYLRAWAIALSVILLSFAGLIAFGVGFLFASVWAWAVIGYAFTVAIFAPVRGDLP